ncbi:RES family NAD+ phosphorylase [Rhizobium sp. SL42]|uniref:RES family NAD+ phosphorylase n=1 Tax=Rhizobium sp. SL42 TaxID=2806346 RepID=UPI001F29B8FA|nr:RES family NAD+ phosphorylase [Rhizobium sp. SL42]UJW77728.1 RES family NAD+ phosphorylase [Rhizobium sp. SL42]
MKIQDSPENWRGDGSQVNPDARYEQITPDDYDWQEGWQAFETSIKSEARFFSRTAARQLDDLFATIGEMQTRNGRPIIVDAGPETALTQLFRARVFQSTSQLETALARPDLSLAPPPSRLASAGRMNAHGISVFYGATEAGIALAEVRPPVGSHVMVARFDIARRVRLLDLTSLPDLMEDGSIFDPQYAVRLGRMRFMKTLTRRMSRPVMPDDQMSDYLPTQAVADFLATESKTPLDGIIFPSVQATGWGLNVVLFHKSSRVEELDIPKDTDISAQTHSTDDEGPYPDFTVYEEVPPAERVPEEQKPRHPFMIPSSDWDDIAEGDYRETTLRIDPQAVWVHVIEGVKIETSQHKVSRHRWTKTDTPF